MAGPISTPLQRVLPEWIDANGHMNMAYYNVVFDRAADAALDELGLGAAYVASGAGSLFIAEVHVTYLVEMKENDPLLITLQLLAWDEKRLHYFESLYHAQEGYLAATSEQLALHIGMPARRVSPFPPERQDAIRRLANAHAGLPKPPQIGHVIGISRVPAHRPAS